MISPDPHLDYHPINYEQFPPEVWGEGSAIVAALSPDLAHFWQAALPYQDKRHDRGHAEIVTWFALRLSAFENLSPSESAIAIAASIGHDIGWSQIEGVEEKFSTVLRARFSEDESLRAQAKTEERELRIAHQEAGARLTRELLGAHFAGVDEVCSIILDHDTRLEEPSRSAKVLWDADILWRVTVVGRAAGMRQTGLSSQSWSEVARDELLLSRRKLQTRIALQMGTREYQNTLDYCSRLSSDL